MASTDFEISPTLDVVSPGINLEQSSVHQSTQSVEDEMQSAQFLPDINSFALYDERESRMSPEPA
jgi:hypothetical protein